MRFLIKWGLLLIPALALAMPAVAQTRNVGLSDSQQPGSVIVFPKFINAAAVHVDNAVLPRTEVEIGIVCPPGITPDTTVCFEHQIFKLHLHWVCPGSQDIAFKYVCKENDFFAWVSLNGKIVISADGKSYFTNQVKAPKPLCRNGYLVAWVVDNADKPIKFDGLIGDVVLRGPDLTAAGVSTVPGHSTAVSAYQGITIQADPALKPLAAVSFAGNELHFSGLPGEYQAIPGKLYGDVKFDNPDTGRATNALPAPANAFSQTWLILLTLDTNSNHPNNATFVPVNFTSESNAGTTANVTNPLFEFTLSESVEFLCWGQFLLSNIDENLTQDFFGLRKGTFTAGPAEKFQGPFSGDETGAVTLLGLVHTVEGTAANAYQERSYIFGTYNDSVPVETELEFLPSLD